MPSEPSAEETRSLSATLDVPPSRLLRALHAYNMAVSLDLGPQRRQLLRGLYEAAGQPPPDDAKADRMLALGPVSELRALPDMSPDELRALVAAFGRDDLNVALQELLAELTGVNAEVPEAELPPMPPAAVQMVADTDVRWDVIFCSYDVSSRRHRLTLLRDGGWVTGEPLPEGADLADPDPDAEALLGVLADAPIDDDEVAALQAHTRAFRTPVCPDQDALIARLTAAHGPFDQLYLLELHHELPNPARLEQHFSFREEGIRGRLQGLSRRYGYRPTGLGVSAEATLSARWDSPAQLHQRDRERTYQPPLLQSDNVAALQMSAGWQLRQGWRATIRPLTDGVALPVEVAPALSGVQHVTGDGHLQERFLLLAAQVAGVHDGDAYLAHSGEAVPEPPSWPAGASLGAGDLSVLIGDREVSLAEAGEQLHHELRPVPNVVPSLDHTRRWAAPTAACGTTTLTGVTVIEQTARMSDAMAAAQAKATAAVKTDTLCGLVARFNGRLDVSLAGAAGPGHSTPHTDGALWEHPEAGQIHLDGVLRWRLCWRVHEREHAVQWQTPIDLVSGTSTWSASDETVRDSVEASHAIRIKQVAGSYWLEAVEPAQATSAVNPAEE